MTERLCVGALDDKRWMSTADTSLRWVEVAGSAMALVEYSVTVRGLARKPLEELRWMRADFELRAVTVYSMTTASPPRSICHRSTVSAVDISTAGSILPPHSRSPTHHPALGLMEMKQCSVGSQESPVRTRKSFTPNMRPAFGRVLGPTVGLPDGGEHPSLADGPSWSTGRTARQRPRCSRTAPPIGPLRAASPPS
jgi:hypothetical protein